MSYFSFYFIFSPIWIFQHVKKVVVVQYWTSKKCNKKRDARAELLIVDDVIIFITTTNYQNPSVCCFPMQINYKPQRKRIDKFN